MLNSFKQLETTLNSGATNYVLKATNKQRQAAMELMDREDLVITRADKGGAIFFGY